MLTKYIALEYFHLPDSADPTSIMFSPLTPNGGRDDLYESDLHSEASANGRKGKPYPCLYFLYSYKTHEIKPDEPVLSDCSYHNPVGSPEEEIFETNLAWGGLMQRSMDLRLDSTPAIEFRRGYNSGYEPPQSFAMGWGANHSLNPWLSSNGMDKLTLMDLNHEDGVSDRMPRVTPGEGFNPGAAYESRADWMYGARLTWAGGHYRLQYRDGAWARFLPCVDPKTHCYLYSYQDAKGDSLRFERGLQLELRRLTASDNQGITFVSDDHQRTVEATATNGDHVSYEYDAAGCLARVHRVDGQETLYEYDAAYRMTSISVVRQAGAAPEPVLANEYDAQGRLVKQTLSGVGSYQFEYLAVADGHTSQLKVTTPEGEMLDITIGKDSYLVRSSNMRFPAIPAH